MNGLTTAANASYQNQIASAVAAPRTISSAIGRIEHLNERLNSLRSQAGNISDQIGGPRPATDAAKGIAGNPVAPSAVSRLNDSADYAHDLIDQIEGILASVGRALG